MQADFVTVHVGIQEQEFPTVRGLFDEDVSIEGFSCRPTLQCRRTSRVSRTVPAPAPVRGVQGANSGMGLAHQGGCVRKMLLVGVAGKTSFV